MCCSPWNYVYALVFCTVEFTDCISLCKISFIQLIVHYFRPIWPTVSASLFVRVRSPHLSSRIALDYLPHIMSSLHDLHLIFRDSNRSHPLIRELARRVLVLIDTSIPGLNNFKRDVIANGSKFYLQVNLRSELVILLQYNWGYT